jgi:hypothetical protein
MVDLQRHGSDWAKVAIKDIERIGTLADTWRNTVAHVSFGPHGDGVKFLAIKAKGKLTFPNVERSEVEFLAVSKEISTLAGRVKEIADTIALPAKTLGVLLDEWATQAAKQPEIQNYLGRLLLGFPDSAPTTSEEFPQTPQGPQE